MYGFSSSVVTKSAPSIAHDNDGIMTLQLMVDSLQNKRQKAKSEKYVFVHCIVVSVLQTLTTEMKQCTKMS